eukprot:gene23317-30557_t
MGIGGSDCPVLGVGGRWLLLSAGGRRPFMPFASVGILAGPCVGPPGFGVSGVYRLTCLMHPTDLELKERKAVGSLPLSLGGRYSFDGLDATRSRAYASEESFAASMLGSCAFLNMRSDCRSMALCNILLERGEY